MPSEFFVLSGMTGIRFGRFCFAPAGSQHLVIYWSAVRGKRADAGARARRCASPDESTDKHE